MSRVRQLVFCAATAAMFFSAVAQIPPAPNGKPVTDTAKLIPPLFPPTAISPVAFFRQLLVMSPVERNTALTNRPPETCERIKAKVREYLALDADERELRLRATELRWYLAPLFRVPAADRAARVAQTPEELRGIVQSRLAQWDALTPALQQEFLDNDKTLHYFARVETTNAIAASPEQQKISEQFNQFFELTPEEKLQTLNTLSDAERAAMEKTLATFEKLPPQQRVQCTRNYAKFAGMSGPERTEFLKNAERWSQMSPKERQSWRDLVAHIPMMPPMPGVSAPLPPNLIPHTTPKIPRASIVTN